MHLAVFLLVSIGLPHCSTIGGLGLRKISPFVLQETLETDG